MDWGQVPVCSEHLNRSRRGPGVDADGAARPQEARVFAAVALQVLGDALIEAIHRVGVHEEDREVVGQGLSGYGRVVEQQRASVDAIDNDALLPRMLELDQRDRLEGSR